MDADRTFRQDLLLAVGMGFGIAFLHLFFVGGLLASWAAGTTYALLLIMGLRVFEPRGYLGIVVLSGVGGGMGGLVWRSLAETTATPFEALGGGALAAAGAMVVGAWIESRNDRGAA